MRPMLDIEHRGRWQLSDLMTTRPMTRDLLRAGELTLTPRTALRVMINDIRHLVCGHQLAPSARVTMLAARLALLPSFFKSSFAFARASARRC
jgi:hypothetical protein